MCVLDVLALLLVEEASKRPLSLLMKQSYDGRYASSVGQAPRATEPKTIDGSFWERIRTKHRRRRLARGIWKQLKTLGILVACGVLVSGEENK